MQHVRVIALLLVAALAACSDRSDDRPDAGGDAGPVVVVATTAMIADPARIIGGEHVIVTSLMGEGVDPHLFKPTRADMAALLQADLVLSNGLHLEGRMTDALERVAADGTPVHAVAEGLDKSTLLAFDADPALADPHVWMDPLAWLEATKAITEALIEADPDHAETFLANATVYQDQLRALDAYARKTLETIPESRRVLVTAHDAFNYFARRYGLEVRAIQGISTVSEAGVRDIENLVDLLVTRDIRAVFIESSVSARNIRALIAGAEARGHAVALGGSLYSDAMGPADTYEGTYLGMLDHNITTIVHALGGSAPERGLHGTLVPPDPTPNPTPNPTPDTTPAP